MMKIPSWLTCVTLSCSGLASAHDAGLSSLRIQLQERNLEVIMTLAPSDVASLSPLDRGSLETAARDWLAVQFNGQPVPFTVEARRVRLSGNNDNIQLRFKAERRGAAIEVRSLVLRALPPGHKQYASFHGESGAVEAEWMLDASRNQVAVSRPGRAKRSSFLRFLTLGVGHFATGYDHVLFLIALLSAGGGLLNAAGVITSFTIAHSITLALAAFSVINIPSAFVEPAIAASIVFAGAGNLLRRTAVHADPAALRNRWLVVFAFGLVHGLGFASVLQESGIGSDGEGLTLPLLGFNAGVELGQLAAACIVLPCIWWLAGRPVFRLWLQPGFSFAVCVAGVYWLIARLVGGA